jgi:hypothetical protein
MPRASGRLLDKFVCITYKLERQAIIRHLQ